MTEQVKKTKFFLPYQMRWLNDNSKVKIWEKSRRIGATYVQSYEDVRDCVKRIVPAVWFSSADESAAREYIDYCKQWATLFNIAAKDLGEQVLDKEKDIKAYVIQFSNGTKIHALSSNPIAAVRPGHGTGRNAGVRNSGRRTLLRRTPPPRACCAHAGTSADHPGAGR